MRIPAVVHALLQSENGCWITSILQELRHLSLWAGVPCVFFLGQFALINLARIRIFHWNLWEALVVLVVKPVDSRDILTSNFCLRRWLNYQWEPFNSSLGGLQLWTVKVSFQIFPVYMKHPVRGSCIVVAVSSWKSDLYLNTEKKFHDSLNRLIEMMFVFLLIVSAFSTMNCAKPTFQNIDGNVDSLITENVSPACSPDALIEIQSNGGIAKRDGVHKIHACSSPWRIISPDPDDLYVPKNPKPMFQDGILLKESPLGKDGFCDDFSPYIRHFWCGGPIILHPGSTSASISVLNCHTSKWFRSSLKVSARLSTIVAGHIGEHARFEKAYYVNEFCCQGFTFMIGKVGWWHPELRTSTIGLMVGRLKFGKVPIAFKWIGNHNSKNGARKSSRSGWLRILIICIELKGNFLRRPVG